MTEFKFLSDPSTTLKCIFTMF